MDRRMRVITALICFIISLSSVRTLIPGVDGPVTTQEALEGGNATLLCDTSIESSDDKFTLLVWYKDNDSIYSYDVNITSEWASPTYNTSGRLKADLQNQPTILTITELKDDDQALYHCRVDFKLAPTRNIGVNLTVIVLPSQPFFLDEVRHKGKRFPYQEGDILVLSCLVTGGRPPPKISWYSGNDLVDASDGVSEIPNVRKNDLYLPLTRHNAASLTCRASNTHLIPPMEASPKIELYLPAYKVTIKWIKGMVDDALQAGRPAFVQCVAFGTYPRAEITWMLDHKNLTHHSNQSWNNVTRRAESFLKLSPAVGDNGAKLVCNVTNSKMALGRNSKLDVIILNVTYSPIVEVKQLQDGKPNVMAELDSLHLECVVRANPPVEHFTWYFNDAEIRPYSLWGRKVASNFLIVEEVSRNHSGWYSCSAKNNVGETRTEGINITILYSPKCKENAIKLVKETLKCSVTALPKPDSYFWHIQPAGEVVRHLKTGSAILPLSQITGSLSQTLDVSCAASNGIASQEKPCKRVLDFGKLRPSQPKQCDLAFEYEEFQIKCIPVENATYYEVSVWRMSTSNYSQIKERKESMGYGVSQALSQGEGIPRFVRGSLGSLRVGDETSASACNRYGCSSALLLRPTENLLNATSSSWWKLFLEGNLAIMVVAVVLVSVFLLSVILLVRVARRRCSSGAPVIQVLQLDEVTRDYLNTVADQTLHASRSLRSCSSGYSDGSEESAHSVRRWKPRDRHRARPPRGHFNAT